ncbi:MAG: O-antigen ligase family protein [Planctomycetota bacterium]
MTLVQETVQAHRGVSQSLDALGVYPTARRPPAALQETFFMGALWLFYVFVLTFRPQELWLPLGVMRPAMMSKMALLGGLVISGLRWRYRMPQLYARVAMAAAAALSVPFSYYPVLSLRLFFQEFLMAVFFLVGINSVRSLKLVRHSLWICLASYTVSCGWALAAQGDRARIGGIVSDIAGSSDLGIVLTMTVGIAMGLLSRCRKHSAKLILCGAIVVCSFGVVRTGSRGTFLGFIAMVVLWTFLSRRLFARRALGLMAATAVALVLLLPTGRLSRQATILDREGQEAGQYRLDLMTGAVKMFCDYPLTGVGVGCFPRAFFDYRPKSYEKASPWGAAWMHCHNLYFTVLAEMGLPGIVSILALHFYTLWALFRIVRSGDRAGVLGERECLAQALLLALFGSCAGSLFVPGRSVPFDMLLILSVTVCYSRPTEARKAPRRMRKRD